MTYEIMCLCHENTLMIEGPMGPEVGRTRSEIEAATSRGWVAGVRDPLLHPDEVNVYCSELCRDVDAAMVRHFRPSNYRGFLELSGFDPDDLPAAYSAISDGRCETRLQGQLMHFVTWLLDNPEENERGRLQHQAVAKEKASCDGDTMRWLIKRADRIKATLQAFREGKTPPL